MVLASKFFISLFVISLVSKNSVSDNAEELSLLPDHLEPLGSKHNKSSVKTLSAFPQPRDFFENYVTASVPVLFKSVAKLSPAFVKWTDDYFLSSPEAETFMIDIENGKKENRTKGDLRRASFKEFVETYKKRDVYMVNGVPSFIQKDVLLPPPLLCKDVVQDMLVDTVMWFSSGGTKSVLHNDDVDNINCLFSGTKELLFIDYKKYKNKVPIDFPSGGYSGVDVDRVDLVKYPSLKDVEYFNVTMEPGDCLFIPYKWFHQVRSYDRNIAVNVWWTHKVNFIPEDCNMEPNQTLDKFNFSSLEAESSDQEQAGPPDLMDQLFSLVKSGKKTFKEFEELLKNEPAVVGDQPFVWNEQFSSAARKIFEAIDTDSNGELTTGDIIRLEEDSSAVSVVENGLASIEDLIEDQVAGFDQLESTGELETAPKEEL